jgi:predicted transposase/invertase (TIGR01784 family)
MYEKTNQILDAQKNKFLPLTSDIVFKRVFSREGNEDILKALLEAILDTKIQKIEIKNPQLPSNLLDSKAGILDIKVEIDENTICDVEMQVKNEKNIDSRSTFYMAKMLSDELKKSEEYIKVKKTIVINLLNFSFYKRNSYRSTAHMKFEPTRPEEYVDLGYKKEDEIATKDLEMHFIEIPKFLKKNPEIKNKLSQWLWVLVGEEEKVKEAEKENEDVKKAMEIIKEMSMDPKEWELYESRKLAIMDYNTGMHQARIDGEEERFEKAVLRNGIEKRY